MDPFIQTWAQLEGFRFILKVLAYLPKLSVRQAQKYELELPNPWPDCQSRVGWDWLMGRNFKVATLKSQTSNISDGLRTDPPSTEPIFLDRSQRRSKAIGDHCPTSCEGGYVPGTAQD